MSVEYSASIGYICHSTHQGSRYICHTTHQGSAAFMQREQKYTNNQSLEKHHSKVVYSGYIKTAGAQSHSRCGTCKRLAKKHWATQYSIGAWEVVREASVLTEDL